MIHYYVTRMTRAELLQLVQQQYQQPMSQMQLSDKLRHALLQLNAEKKQLLEKSQQFYLYLTLNSVPVKIEVLYL